MSDSCDKDKYFRNTAKAICEDVVGRLEFFSSVDSGDAEASRAAERTVGYLVARVQGAFPHRPLGDLIEIAESVVFAAAAERKGQADE